MNRKTVLNSWFISLTIMALLTAWSARAQSSFFQAVTNLNPVAYWPLQETAQPPVADVETNYGSLGGVGNAYYTGTAVLRGASGVTGDGDTCVKFLNTSGSWLAVPVTDRRVSLPVGAFTVEAWVNPTNTTSANEAWTVVAQTGTAVNGGANAAGWGLVQNYIPSLNNYNTWGWTFHVFNGVGTTGGAEAAAPYRYSANTWYHLVGVYDGTNAYLYVNGVLASQPMATGTYARDTWDPLTIGATWPNTKGYAGYIDEVAIYTNALSSSRIQNHYNNVNSSSYPSIITNTDNAYMYWRMDAPAYTDPPVSAYPVAANLGSAASGNGLYLSGTTPGVAGPSLSGLGSPSYGCGFNGIGTDTTNTTTIYKFGNSVAATYPLTSGIMITNMDASLNLSNQVETMMCWFKANPADNRFQGLIGLHGSSGARVAISSGQLQWYSGAGGNLASGTPAYNDGNWHFLVGVYTNAGTFATGTNFLYIDGALVGVAANSSAQSPTLTNQDMLLGGEGDYAANANVVAANERFFDGSLAQIAYFTNALTAAQIANLYTNATGGLLPSAPVLTGQPITGRTNGVNGLNGSGPGSIIFMGVNFYDATGVQWYFNSASNYAGATLLANGNKYAAAYAAVIGVTNQQMTISNLVDSDSGYYYVVVSNNFGSVTSILASLKVMNEPYLTGQSPAGGTVQLYPNQNLNLSVTAGGTNSVYQWYTNNAADTTSGTGSSYTVTSVQPAMSGSQYYCVITNLTGMATSAPVTLSVIPFPASLTSSAYATNVLALNPSDYWPMHETIPPAQGDIETNYGSLGALGNGYYEDWNVLNLGLVTHGLPGALVGNANPCVAFAGSNNASLVIPHSSALATIQTPFTLEAWIRPFNDNSYSVILGQGGGAGLNTVNNGTNIGGFALQYSGTPDTFSLVSWDGVGAASYEQKTSASYPPNSWYHLVCTFDGTNVAYYVNGNQAGFGTLQSAWPGPMVPDSWSPLVIGGGRWTSSGPTHPFAGLIDHVAIYTNLLSSSDIYQHYNDGANGSVTAYEADVHSDNPLMYYRMNSPAYTTPPQSAWPVLTNYGTAALNGVYSPGVVPGGVGGPSESGILSTSLSGTNAMPGNGVSSFADAGDATALSANPINYQSYSYSIWFKGDPSDARAWNALMSGNDSTWRCAINQGAGQFYAIGDNAAVTSTRAFNDGNWHQGVVTCVGISTNLAAPFTIDAASNNVYVDGQLIGSNISVSNTPAFKNGGPVEVMLGNESGYTTNGTFGRSFAGNVCEAAFWNGTVLTSNQVQTLYAAAGMAPYIFTQPVSAALNATVVFTNSVAASGSGALAYQWYKNNQALPIGGQTNLEFGATNASLVFYQLQTNDASADYYVVVTNQFGSVTSSVVALTVFGAPTFTNEPVLVTLTNNILLFSNATPTFKVGALGAQPLYLQWYTNGLPATAQGTTLTSYTLPPIPLGNAGVTNFYCVASNFLGMATNTPIGITGLPAPTAPYPATVLADHPQNYWRLNEPNLDNVNNGTLADDYWGGKSGIYTNTQLGQTGYSATTDPSETSAYFGGDSLQDNDAYGIGGVDFSAPTNVSSSFSIEAWVNGYPQTKSVGIVSKGWGNGGEQFDLDTGSPGNDLRFFVRDSAGTTHLVNSSIGFTYGNWYHVVGVCDETNGVVTLYVNGAPAGTASISSSNGILSSARNVIIGSRPSNATTNNNDAQFVGNVDDVAIYNYALTAAQVGAHYGAAGEPPYFSQLPSLTITTNGLAALTLPATVVGTGPLTYSWLDVNANTNVATGSTNGAVLTATLAIGSLPITWNGDSLQLTVNNSYGSTNITVALTLYTNAPAIIVGLPPQVNVVSGRAYNYSLSLVGPQPYAYQWYANGTPIAGQTGATFSPIAGAPGSSTNFSVIVTNIFGAVTSSVSLFTALPTNSYAGFVAGLNPVGYWPLQETNPPAPATIETNYGSLGSLGNAYYSYTNSTVGAIPGGTVTLQQGGVTSDNDNSVSFTGNANSYALVPRSTPALTLKPPMSLECWVNSSSTGFSDLLGESGAGLNAAADGGNWGGVRLSYGGNDAGGPNLQFYVCNGSGTTRNSVGTPANSLPTGQWHHCVATYDGTTTMLYIDGVLQTSDSTSLAGANTENPDTWTPFSLGGSFWQTNGGTMLPVRSYQGQLDEVAVYTNILTQAQVSAHYAAVSGNYPQTITNDRALLYYRMDCQIYTNPPATLYPIAVNYGSAPESGFYQSGITPGAVPGPAMPTLGTNVLAAPGNGMFSCVDGNSDPTFNVAGTNKFSAMVWFKGYPADPRVQTVMSHGITNWAINLDGTSGYIVWNTYNGGNVTSTNVLNDGKWHFLVGVEDGRTNYLYVDGGLNAFAALATTNGLTSEPAAHVYLGGNQDVAAVNSNQRYLNGAVAEAALFTNALTAAQVAQAYQSAFTAGGPFITASPLSPVLVMPGYTYANSVSAIGQAPLSYQWTYNGLNLSDGSVVSGSRTNSLSVSNVITSDAGNYQVVITNSLGSVTSSVAVLIVGSLPIGFDSSAPGWTLNQSGTFSVPAMGTNGLLTLTDNGGSEARSFFFEYPQYIGAFKAAFTYQAGGSKAADGAAFCIQDDPRGAAALGGGGGTLGVSGIIPSAELEMNLYASQGMGYVFHTNGATQGYLTPGSVNFASGDPINVNIYYASGQMSVTFTDAVASTSFSTTMNVGDLTQVLSNDVAYVGFTGADGGSVASQTITNFSFVSIPPVAVHLSGANSALVMWPGEVAGYQLQQNSNLATTNWVTLTNAVLLSNDLNQIAVPVSSSNTFYRLFLSTP